MYLIERAKVNLDLKHFRNHDTNPMCLGKYEFDLPKDQYILRMLVKGPDTSLIVPKPLRWLEWTICNLYNYHCQYISKHPYIYVTTRIGEVSSKTDDIWHVDGFGLDTPHIPEQNYIWADHTPTEVLHQNFAFPEDFDAKKHHIHWYFNDHVSPLAEVETLQPKNMYLIDPYVVHRRPPTASGHRSFIRISFLPLPIKDDKNTQNPLLPVAPWKHRDIRETLVRYS